MSSLGPLSLRVDLQAGEDGKLKSWGLIKAGQVTTEGLLNRIEMAFRAYDPCLACATNAVPGPMPLIVNIYDHEGTLVRSLSRD